MAPKNPQMHPGTDVLYSQTSSERIPGKLIRPEGEGWNVILFTETGTRNVKNIPYSSTPTPNTFCLLEEAEFSVAAGSGR